MLMMLNDIRDMRTFEGRSRSKCQAHKRKDNLAMRAANRSSGRHNFAVEKDGGLDTLFSAISLPYSAATALMLHLPQGPCGLTRAQASTGVVSDFSAISAAISAARSSRCSLETTWQNRAQFEDAGSVRASAQRPMRHKLLK